MTGKNFVTLMATLLSLLIGVSLAAGAGRPGAVYTMTNAPAPDGNEVVIFDRDARGMLSNVGSISTGGDGSGGDLDQLGSQGSLILSHDRRWLLAVNAGSNEISVFRILSDGLDLIDTVDSGGTFPVSLTVFHDLVYVLNAMGSPNITGFHLSHTGLLEPLTDSTRSLGAGSFAQVGFDPKGQTLVVTDKSDNEILLYSVGQDGLPSTAPVTSMSNGLVPFGFIFDQRGHLLASEAGSGAVSSYDILANGTLQVISPSVANGQSATCWIAGNRRYAFTANTGSNTISAYRVKPGNGRLVLLRPVAGPGDLPIDLGTTVNGRFLYVLNAGSGTIGMFRIRLGGRLFNLGDVDGGLSIYAQGLVAR